MRIIVVTAHPDDAEAACGGVCLKWTARGDEVWWLSCTNGDGEHHLTGGLELAKRRYVELHAAADICGAQCRLWDISTGELEANLPNRRRLVELLRAVAPQLVLTHRPVDFEPDHRAVAHLTLHAVHAVTAPNSGVLTDPMRARPPVFYLHDPYLMPAPFSPDVAVGIDAQLAGKQQLLACHESQVFEWQPHQNDAANEPPTDSAARAAWLQHQVTTEAAMLATTHREAIRATYGGSAGDIGHVEVFQYTGNLPGASLPSLKELFPL